MLYPVYNRFSCIQNFYFCWNFLFNSSHGTRWLICLITRRSSLQSSRDHHAQRRRGRTARQSAALLLVVYNTVLFLAKHTVQDLLQMSRPNTFFFFWQQQAKHIASLQHRAEMLKAHNWTLNLPFHWPGLGWTVTFVRRSSKHPYSPDITHNKYVVIRHF